jgi:2,4-dienoyl-CoA reductase-like NADH-dependent reductase (Old Yellow Enzyme family)
MNPSLTSPFDLGTRTFKNRMIAAPPPSMTCSFEGLVTAEMIEYYQRLAETGVAAVILEGAAVTTNARAWTKHLDLSRPEILTGLSQVAEKIRRGGALPFLQLYHGGCNSIPIEGKKLYGVGKPLLKKISADIRPLSQDMIDQIIRDFVAAAVLAWNAGFSGLEIQGADGSLIQQFLSPLTNSRDDEYGLKNANGAFFARQVIRGIKNVTPDLTLSMRLSLKDLLPGGYGIRQAVSTAKLFKQEGVDVFHVTQGLIVGNPLMIHPAVGKAAPEAPFAEDAQIFRHEVEHPIMLSGKLDRPTTAEQKISRNVCDFVSFGRTLNRNPRLPAFAGKPEEFNGLPCLRCKVCIAAAKGCPDKHIPFARII